MNKTIPEKTRLTSDQIRNLPSFRKARRAILKLERMEGRATGRGRTIIPTTRIRIGARIRARRSLASVRRATTDSGGDPDPDPDPEPPRSHTLYSLPASPVGGGL